MTNIKKIAIYGAGGFGREVKMLIDQINENNHKYDFIGYFDDKIEIGKLVNGSPILGGLDKLKKYDSELELVIAIGSPEVKRKIINEINNIKITYPKLIHPNVLIGRDHVLIGEGSIVCAGCILTVNINIGRHVILNLGCTVGHDTNIGDYCSIMPAVNVSGEVNMHELVYVGTGAKIINQVEIGANSIIGAGAVVTKSIPSGCTAVGVPAKPINVMPN